DSFECPDFFELPLDGGDPKWVLVRGDGKYSVGTFDGTTFTEETEQLRSDAGPNFYATQTWNNTETGDGRRIQAAWMRDGRYPGMPFNQQVTIPCELTLRTVDGQPRLFRTPIRELTTLYSGTARWSGTVKPGAGKVLADGPVEADLHLDVEIPSGATLTVDVCGTTVELTGTTVASQAVSGGLRTVRILIDRTSIEVFANDGEVSISSCYLPAGGGLVLTATAPVQVATTLHSLASMWPDR
ncbi:GH32 C-terminal domain-containing protein, partial [Kribbella sp.]|uniref:GH32 C-terminal domain-containing protein n=1 Tax=Kribbella sp. TaxID=1871183 RepID=UPI002D682C2D